jgi:hypothetical protein
MFHNDPMEANLYALDPPDEDQPLDEEAPIPLDQLDEEPSEDALEESRQRRRQRA